MTPQQAELVALLTELGKLSLSLRSLATDQEARTPIPTRSDSMTWDKDVSHVLKTGRLSSRLLVLRGSNTQDVTGPAGIKLMSFAHICRGRRATLASATPRSAPQSRAGPGGQPAGDRRRPARAPPETIATDGTLTIELHKGRVIRLPRPAATVFVADPEIADVQAQSPSIVYLFGKRAGETSLYAVDENDQLLLRTHVVVAAQSVGPAPGDPAAAADQPGRGRHGRRQHRPQRPGRQPARRPRSCASWPSAISATRRPCSTASGSTRRPRCICGCGSPRSRAMC